MRPPTALEAQPCGPGKSPRDPRGEPSQKGAAAALWCLPSVTAFPLPLTTQALAELVAAQEAATPAGLMAAMAGFVDPGTADYLMRDSGARPR